MRHWRSATWWFLAIFLHPRSQLKPLTSWRGGFNHFFTILTWWTSARAGQCALMMITDWQIAIDFFLLLSCPHKIQSSSVSLIFFPLLFYVCSGQSRTVKPAHASSSTLPRSHVVHDSTQVVVVKKKRMCARCAVQLGRFFNTGAPCPTCGQKICSDCRVKLYHRVESRKKSWICTFCAKERQVSLGSLENTKSLSRPIWQSIFTHHT